MGDVYLTIGEAGPEVVDPLIQILELRAADAGQRAMREAYFSDVTFPPGARVLEVGCGPGPVARALAGWPGVAEVVGVDPSPLFIAKARELAAGLPQVSFEVGDALSLPLKDSSFDVVVFHTTLCHIPGPERALAEALRVLRPGGTLAIFDGDYSTTTVALSDGDPVQACVRAVLDGLIHDRWLVRRLPNLVREAGFEDVWLRGHSYVEARSSTGYMLALIGRGADALLARGEIGAATAEALKAEARRRSDAGEWFGHIAYASLTARKLSTS
ncbi:MAG TPA: methyltransferase domain-containing protein [Candidatus Limnocylindrales bacterium]|nr:methyltransferase domain-containing protein [Candidatus Limnocylindrales bacterium]